jgi:hypothetical protein
MKLFVRLAVMLGATLLYGVAVRNLFPTEDANIGAGLAYFGLLLLASGIWGLWDGSHASTLPPVFVRWTVIAIAVGVSIPVRIWFEEGRDADVLFSDLTQLTPFMAALVLAPAAVGIALGYATDSGPDVS